MNDQENHEITHCKDCGRFLRSPMSRANAQTNGGRGPVCQRNHERALRVLARTAAFRETRQQAIMDGLLRQPGQLDPKPAPAGTSNPGVSSG